MLDLCYDVVWGWWSITIIDSMGFQYCRYRDYILHVIVWAGVINGYQIVVITLIIMLFLLYIYKRKMSKNILDLRV